MEDKVKVKDLIEKLKEFDQELVVLNYWLDDELPNDGVFLDTLNDKSVVYIKFDKDY